MWLSRGPRTPRGGLPRRGLGALWLVSVMLAGGACACPRSCHCTERSGLVVQCAARGLESVPEDLPGDTVALVLSHNRIRRIPGRAFGHLRRLRELDLSHNAIDSVEPGAFAGLSESLRALDLSGNRLSGVPRDAFGELRARVRLSDNPWHCGCSLQETLRGLRLDPETAHEVSCSTSAQEEHVGRPVTQVLDSGVNFCSEHRRTTDLAMLVAMFGWFAMVIAYVVYYVRHNQEDARRHMEYLKSLPGAAHVGKDCDTANSAV